MNYVSDSDLEAMQEMGMEYRAMLREQAVAEELAAERDFEDYLWRENTEKTIADQKRRIVELEEALRGVSKHLRSAWDKPAKDHYDRYEHLAETNREARERIKRVLDTRRGKGSKK